MDLRVWLHNANIGRGLPLRGGHAGGGRGPEGRRQKKNVLFGFDLTGAKECKYATTTMEEKKQFCPTHSMRESA